MSETKPLRTCSVSKDDVAAMGHEDTSLEHVIKTEEVDLKPDYIECNSDGYIEMTDMDEHIDDGNEIVNSHNDDSSLTSNTDVHIKEGIISQHDNDESEIYQDEETKELNDQDTEVKPEIDTNDGIVPLNEHGIPNDFNTEMKMKQMEENHTNIYSENATYLKEASNKKTKRVIKDTNKHSSKVKSDTKKKLDHKDKTYICNDCSYQSVYEHSFIRHLRKHSGQKPYSCNFCEYRCARKAQLTVHLRRHDGEKPFSCHFCKYQNASKSGLKRHLTKHSAEKPCNVEAVKGNTDESDYVRDRTPLTETSNEKNKTKTNKNIKYKLKSDTTDKKNKKAKTYLCNDCSYKSVKRGTFIKHLKTHDKLLSCNICEYKCAHKYRLINHLTSHTGEKTFLCEFCYFRCTTHSDLKIHSRIHTGEKPFLCSHCEYRCAKNSNLKRHLMTHTGEKPFSCKICDYKSSQIGHLTRHLKKHTGEKPFSCRFCQYKCASRTHLVRHSKTHC